MAALSDIGSSIIRTVMAQNDAFRIRCYGCLNDNSTGDGKVEFATADDGTEPIYVRQYKGNANDYFGDIVHEACLLDSNGNTSFPGTIYGNLRGMLLPVSVSKQIDLSDLYGTVHFNGGWTAEFENYLPSDYKDADFNGFQIGDDGQRIQILANGPSLDYRSNDANINEATASTEWSNWKRFAFMEDVTAANTGGIVSQSLGTNGYVKFANGLILQWGSEVYSSTFKYSTTIQLPISMDILAANANTEQSADTETSIISSVIYWNGAMHDSLIISTGTDRYSYGLDWVAIGH